MTNIPPRTALTILRTRPRVRRASLSVSPDRRQFGRTYSKPTPAVRPVETRIPPPSTPSPRYQVIQDAERYCVRVDCAAPVLPEQVYWQIEEDILEIEYRRPDCVYYRNFIVPVGWTPFVTYRTQAFEIELRA